MLIVTSRAFRHYLYSARFTAGSLSICSMTQAPSVKATLSHEERTASEPRNKDLHSAIIERITPVNDRIKAYRFAIKDQNGFNFQPGQWLDVHVPGIEKAGGFTITSSPKHAIPSASNPRPYFDLAVQNSPENPPAAWLWQPVESIQGKEVKVRVGGSFVWPPPGIDMTKIERAIFIAGGVGINPLISMLSHMHEEQPSLEVRLLYSTKVTSRETDPSEVLFLPQLLNLFRKPRSQPTKDRVELFFTGTRDGSSLNQNNDEPIQPLMSLTLPKLDTDTEVPVVAWTHRIDDIALSSAAGKKDEASSTVFYVCGPPDMTDYIVQYLQNQEHVPGERVLCEKWW